MALRVLRVIPTIPSRSCFTKHFASVCGGGGGPDVDRQFAVASSSLASTSFRVEDAPCCGNLYSMRSFSSSSDSKDAANELSKGDEEDQPALLYEGPFAALTLRLKVISLTSAVIGIVGLPALSLFYGSAGSVPATGQVAVIATAGLTAVGSTALLSYCFSPYVHTMERLPADDESNRSGNSVRIITRDILARRVETIFDPTTDVSPPQSNNSRPFCNFMVNGVEFYVHPELVHDQKLRVQLVGEDPLKDVEDANKKKLDDDEFL